jgi:alpha-D-ribose 1-methylphosphonate 5-triphosphate synthase subunit PhnL
MMQAILSLHDVAKSFTMHMQGGIRLPVVSRVTFDLHAGACAALGGPSGIGKSSILKMIFGNYRCEAGHILIQGPQGRVDVATASPRAMLALRRSTIGYVSQFLRAVPRVAALDIVAEPLIEAGADRETARARARDLMARLNLPERLWSLPPATFSGGEQQRVNVARGFIAPRPLLLLDEPTASLDTANRDVVVDLIAEARARGTAVLGIFHDADVRARVATDIIDVTRFAMREALPA